MLWLYRLATTLAGPAILLHLRRRRAGGREDPARFPERLGKASRPRPDGRLLWLHAASVGESLSVVPLVERLLAGRPEWSVLVTTGTVTSARLMTDRLPARAIHQYVPVDRAAWVGRFLDHWRPDAAVWVESEFWPNLIGMTARRGCPMALIQGRVSDRSFATWQKHPWLARALLRPFSLVLGQSNEDARRLFVLGAERADCLGNLKAAAPPLPAAEVALETLRAAVGDRPRWLAASTHAGEEALAVAAHRRLAAAHRGLLTVIVPRHPPRGDALRAELDAAGVRVAQRSRGEAPGPDRDVYLADTVGDLGLFYRLCPVAFIGKSLKVPAGEGGGQNPLEAARLGCAVLFGPRMENFPLAAERLTAAGAAEQVADADDLARRLDALLAAPETAAAMGRAGHQVATAEAAALDRIAGRLGRFLDTGGRS
jgi:3-deoxy-D-manno-octulosonic-acid transferase